MLSQIPPPPEEDEPMTVMLGENVRLSWIPPPPPNNEIENLNELQNSLDDLLENLNKEIGDIK